MSDTGAFEYGLELERIKREYASCDDSDCSGSENDKAAAEEEEDYDLCPDNSNNMGGIIVNN